ncbi:MAG: type II/IV secretion system protein [Candidatus Schekmanbacteria bacterium]|nr:type II/IV secretion system protein [Candidatus Schekmanbacteria bacterium]
MGRDTATSINTAVLVAIVGSFTLSFLAAVAPDLLPEALDVVWSLLRRPVVIAVLSLLLLLVIGAKVGTAYASDFRARRTVSEEQRQLRQKRAAALAAAEHGMENDPTALAADQTVASSRPSRGTAPAAARDLPGAVLRMSPQEAATNLRPLLRRAAAEAKDAEVEVSPILDRVFASGDKAAARDIHFEPGENAHTLKFRVDGLLHDVCRIPDELYGRLISRIKVLSHLTVYQRDVPQDGRMSAAVGAKEYDVRVSLLPTLHGEKGVLRLFEATADRVLALPELGMNGPALAAAEQLVRRPQGMIILTGPTGSGKTTTIYAAMRRTWEVRNKTVNIVTIEDPIEMDLGIFNQTQVNVAKGLTFARGLRTILRQDPDVIMVGEIRDLETAQIATQAGLTGHLLYTSIHADSAAGVITRLLQMGIEPFLLASSVLAIVSQRLVRVLCSACKAEEIPPLSLLRQLGIPADSPMRFLGPVGCHQCGGIGYRGRTALFEVLTVDDSFRDQIISKVTTSQLHETARAQGMLTLLEDGLAKIASGTTSLAEIGRVL